MEVTDGENGTLNAAIVAEDSQTVAFTNTYEALGDITFAGTKSIEGCAMKDDDSFKFKFKVEETTEGSDLEWVVENSVPNGKINYPKIEYKFNRGYICRTACRKRFICGYL